MTSSSDIGINPFGALGLERRTEVDNGRNELGQKEFFELMVAQLKHQDPIKPLDSNEFLGQVAQFTAVRGIQDMQSSFADLATALGSSQALQASTLVGRQVLVPRAEGYLDATGGITGAVSLSESTNSLRLTVLDGSGRVVRSLNMGVQNAGTVDLAWDGITDSGQRAAAGVYTLKATVEADGKSVAADTLILGRVESVTLGRGGAEMQLNLTGLGSVGLGQVQEII